MKKCCQVVCWLFSPFSSSWCALGKFEGQKIRRITRSIALRIRLVTRISCFGYLWCTEVVHKEGVDLSSHRLERWVISFPSRYRRGKLVGQFYSAITLMLYVCLSHCCSMLRGIAQLKLCFFPPPLKEMNSKRKAGISQVLHFHLY